MTGVHAPVEIALHDALVHKLKRVDMGEVRGTLARRNLRPPVEAVIIFNCCRIAKPFLQRGNHELGFVGIVAGRIGLRFQPFAQRRTVRGVCPLQIARLLINEHSHIGRALNIGLAAQRIHTATRYADVIEQELKDGHSTGVLTTVAVLRLAEGI